MADISVFFGILVAIAIGFYVGKAVTRREFRKEQESQQARERFGGATGGPSKK